MRVFEYSQILHTHFHLHLLQPTSINNKMKFQNYAYIFIKISFDYFFVAKIKELKIEENVFHLYKNM